MRAPTLDREERRLRRLFRSLLVVSVGAPAVALAACSTSSSPSGAAPEEAGLVDAGADTTLGTGADGDAPADAHSGSDGRPDDGGVGVDGSSVDARIPLCPDGVDAAHPPIDGAAYNDAADDSGCDVFFEYRGCSPLEVAKNGAGCYFNIVQCEALCGFSTSRGCFVVPSNCSQATGNNYILDASSVVVNCTKCLGGRRPARLADAPTPSRDASALGGWFAQLAHLEGASIAAFRTLRAELRAHGAPRALVRMAERAARDEVRHARVTARLARRFGGEPRLPVVRRAKVRSLEALAAENAAEGCVRETFGALLAGYQATRAADPEIRAEMARIAGDETRHAALAWGVARWAARRLGASANARVAAARADAVAELRREVWAATPRDLAEVAGLPTARVAARLFEETTRALWAAST